MTGDLLEGAGKAREDRGLVAIETELAEEQGGWLPRQAPALLNAVIDVLPHAVLWLRCPPTGQQGFRFQPCKEKP